MAVREEVCSAQRDREATQKTAPDWQHALAPAFLKAVAMTWYFTGTAIDRGWLSKQYGLDRQLEEKGGDHIFIRANKNCSHPQLRVQMKISFSMWDFVLVT